MKPLIATALLLANLVSLHSIAHANDSSFGDANGTIVFKKQAEISMDKEVLFISEKNIQVDYVFTNNGADDLVVPIAFPMPPMYFGESDHGELTDFKLWVDGRPVKTQRRLVVLLDQADITSQVEALGWNAEMLIQYLNGQLGHDTDPPFPGHWFGPDGPRFTVSEYFTWQQRFIAGKPLAIRHSYTPSISTGVPQIPEYLIEEFGETTCLDKTAQAGIAKRDKGGLDWTFLEYILLTGNNWQGPIKDFTLRIRKQWPTDLISTCFDGDFRKTDPVTFEFHQKNYRPSNDLNILFVRANERLMPEGENLP